MDKMCGMQCNLINHSCSTIIDICIEFVVYIAIVVECWEAAPMSEVHCRQDGGDITNLLDVRQTRLHNQLDIDDIPWGRDNTG
jgi:hypothetical protein